MAKVDIAGVDYGVLSLMSREAADELGLDPRVTATALIKSTDVVVDHGLRTHQQPRRRGAIN